MKPKGEVAEEDEEEESGIRAFKRKLVRYSNPLSLYNSAGRLPSQSVSEQTVPAYLRR